jgi:hypothetical protein
MDRARTDAAIFDLLTDNVCGRISAQDVRDAFFTAFRKAHTFSVAQYGAIGDGKPHKVGEWLTGAPLDRHYATLESVRTDYPHVQSALDDANYAAFQAALNAAAAAGGGSVFVPAGTYLFSQSTYNGADNQGTPNSGKRPYLVGANNIALVGEGPGSILQKADDGQASAPFESADGYLLAFYRCKHVLIQGLTIHGRANDATTVVGRVGARGINVPGHLTHAVKGQGFDHGIAFESCQYVSVTCCRFMRFFGGCIAVRTQMSGTGFDQPGAPNDARDSMGVATRTDYRSRASIISNNFFHRVENFTTTAGGTDLLLVTNNIFTENILSGIKLNTSLRDVGRYIIANNIFAGGRDDIIVAHSVGNLHIHDNQFYDCRGRSQNDPLAYNHGVWTSWISKVITVITSNEPTDIFYLFPWERRNVTVERNGFVRCGVPIYIANDSYPVRKDYLITSFNNFSVPPNQGQRLSRAGSFDLNGGLVGSHNAPTVNPTTGKKYARLPVPSPVDLFLWGEERGKTFTVEGYRDGDTALATESLPGLAGSVRQPATLTTSNAFRYVAEIRCSAATSGTVSASPTLMPLFVHRNLIIQDNRDFEPFPDEYPRLIISGGDFSGVIVRRNYFDRRVDASDAISLGVVAHQGVSNPFSPQAYEPEIFDISDNVDLNCVYAPGAQDIDGICQSQVGRGPLAVNGAFYHPLVGAALLPVRPGCKIAIASDANDSARTFTIVGLDLEGFEQTETIGGPDRSAKESASYYTAIKSISVDARTAGRIQVGIQRVDNRSAMVRIQSRFERAPSPASADALQISDRKLDTLILRNNFCYARTDRFGGSVFSVATNIYNGTENRSAIARPQRLSSAGDVLIDGSLSSGGAASIFDPTRGYGRPAQRVTITSSGDLSSLTFTVYGVLETTNASGSEAIAGPNNGTSTTHHKFRSVSRVSVSAAAATSFEVGVAEEQERCFDTIVTDAPLGPAIA